MDPENLARSRTRREFKGHGPCERADDAQQIYTHVVDADLETKALSQSARAKRPTFAKAPVGKWSGIWRTRCQPPNPTSEPAYALRASARQAV